jgi:hypothetical protein
VHHLEEKGVRYLFFAGEFLSPPQQANGDKEISVGKKGTPHFRSVG